MLTHTPEKRHDEELNVMRAIAIIGVVVIHASTSALASAAAGSFDALYSLALNQLSRFCVPVFLLVSGLLAYRSYERTRYADLLKARMADLFVPYLVWTTLGFVFFLTYAVTYKGIALAFLTGSGPFYQLYYIPMLLQLFVLLPILIKLASSRNRMVGLLVLTAAAYTVYEATLTTSVLPASLSHPLALVAQSTFALWAVYFCAGLWLARHYVKLRQYIASTSTVMFLIVFVLTAAVMIAEAALMEEMKRDPGLLNYFRITVMLYSFASFALFFKLSLSYRPSLLTKLYKNSFGIYLVHVAVLKLLPAGLHATLPVGIDLPVTTIITLAVSYGAVEIIARTPLSWLLGRQRVIDKSKRKGIRNQMLKG